MSQPSLFERLGGEGALMAAVDLFYRKVLADPITAPFFDGLDMKSQVKKQVSFMAHAFGGPEAYKGRALGPAHAHLVEERGLGDVHFDAVAKHLEATLRELGIAEDLISESVALVDSTRDEVLGRK